MDSRDALFAFGMAVIAGVIFYWCWGLVLWAKGIDRKLGLSRLTPLQRDLRIRELERELGIGEHSKKHSVGCPKIDPRYTGDQCVCKEMYQEYLQKVERGEYTY